MKNFEIKRGQIFYLEDSCVHYQSMMDTYDATKRRLYIVVSNDRFNANSSFVQIAPIISRSYNPKRYYCVPLPAISNNKDYMIDVSMITLVAKSFLTEDRLSEVFSEYTVNNILMMDSIGSAIIRQFDIDTNMHYQNFSNMNNGYYQMPSPTINLHISLDGVDITRKATVEDADVKATITDDLKLGDSNIKSNVENNNNISKNPAREKRAKMIKSVSTSKISTNSGKHLTDDEKNTVIEFLKNNYRKFGGKLTMKQCSQMLEVSGDAIQRYVKQIKNNSTNKVRVSMPKSLDEKFLSDYDNYGTKYIIDHYGQFGFKKAKQVYGAVDNRRKSLKKVVK